MIRIGHAGLGYWGPNLARNFGALADLRWLCDLSPDVLDKAAKAHPQARTTDDFEALLADPEVDAVVIATPVVTHYELAKQALSAGKHKLGNFTVLTDYNKHQSYASTATVQDLEPLADKWRAFGFAVRDVNGHDVDELRDVLTKLPIDADKPSAIICHTVKGKGVAYAENNMTWHHQNKVSAEDADKLIEALEGKI